MFETDKTILGSRTNFEIDVNSKEKLVYNYEIKKRLLKVFTIDNLLTIKKEDYKGLNLKGNLNPYNEEFLIVTKDYLEDLVKNNSDIEIKYINR